MSGIDWLLLNYFVIAGMLANVVVFLSLAWLSIVWIAYLVQQPRKPQADVTDEFHEYLACKRQRDLRKNLNEYLEIDERLPEVPDYADEDAHNSIQSLHPSS